MISKRGRLTSLKSFLVRRIIECTTSYYNPTKLNSFGLFSSNELYEKFKEIDIALNAIFHNNYQIQYQFDVERVNIGTNNYGHNAVLEQFDYKLIIVGAAIIIHYPDITISNSLNEHRDLKNLYVYIDIYIEGDKIVFSKIMGARTTLTQYEAARGYIHSHLQSRGFRIDRFYSDFSDFCLGEGEINFALASLNNSFNVDSLNLFLYTLDNYVRYESIEGGPYMRMNNISSKVYIDTNNIPNVKEYFHNIEYCVISTPSIKDEMKNAISKINWQIVYNKYTIIDNEESNEALFKIVKLCKQSHFTAGNHLYTGVECYRDIDGRYYIDNNSIPSDLLPIGLYGKAPFKFKGTINNEIIEDTLEEQTIMNRTIYLNPIIKKQLKDEFEKYTTESQIENFAVAKLCNS